MPITPLGRSAIALALLLPPVAVPARAQEFRGHAMGQAIPSYTQANPVPGGGELGEVRVLQPVLMGDAGLDSWLRGRLTLNFENWTLANGELAPGAWGEGFIDRRHPHTVVHEAIAWAVVGTTGIEGSVTAGKGFVPFGTDDPMSRPFVRYPVNHHLAQILERAQLTAGVRVRGTIAMEASVFNGDEPETPASWPNMARFGDSWALRLTLFPVQGVEVQGSYADLASPEHRDGAGLDQSKWSASARFDRPVGRVPVYGLVEWARTAEGDNVFAFTTFLAEGAVRWGRHRFGYRFERTTRPEEERMFDDHFRTPRPHVDDTILGVTRWQLHTVHYEVRFEPGPLGVTPFLEASLGNVADEGTGLFTAGEFYGRTDVRGLILGVRLDAGGAMPRMGRYGVVAVTGHSH